MAPVMAILVIDDERDVREFIRNALEDEGYRILLARDGEEGMEIFRDERPDLVITDIVMPRKGGIETIIEMRRERPDARIIAISGGSRNGPDVLHVAKLLGACEVVAKPFTGRGLLDLVRRALTEDRA
jgi:DNA-binding response OmpR family regulator